MDYHFVTFSDGSTALMSSIPGVMSMSVAPDGVHEVSRIDLPEMTEGEFKSLLRQTDTNYLRFDTLSGKVLTKPK